MRLALSLLLATAALAQQRPTFEVATIKPNLDKPNGFSESLPADGSYTGKNVFVWNVIRFAYNLKEIQLSGGPSWVRTQGFDIQAQPAMPVGREQTRLMMQSLLADRFRLKFHRETKDQSGYALKLPKPEHRLQPSVEGQRLGAGKLKLGDVDTPNLSLSALCEIFEFEFGFERPVVNQTGINGPFAFKLQWASEHIPADATSGKPSLFTAVQEQLGLKLESARVPVEMFIIDSIDQPTEN